MSTLGKRLLSSLVLPPGVFILLFLILGLLLRERRGLRRLSLMGALLLYGLSIEPGRDLLLFPLERFTPPGSQEIARAEIVVVLSGGTRDTGFPSGDSAVRLLEGARLARSYRLPLLISGGIVLHHKHPEAGVLKEYFAPLLEGITVYTEPRSENTFENARYTAKLLKELKYKRILLVTSAYHIPRALWMFRRAGVDAIPYPCDYKREMDYGLASFFPRSDLLNDSAKGLKEYLGLIAYALYFLVSSGKNP